MRFRRILYLEPGGSGQSRSRPCVLRIAEAHGASLTIRRVRPGAVERATSPYDLVVSVACPDSLQWPLRYAPAERDLISGWRCPVWILHPAQSGPIRMVLAGVDVSRGASESLAARVVETAAAFARAAGAEVRLVHAFTVTGESLIRSRYRGGSPHALVRVLRAEASERRARLQALVRRTAVRPKPEIALVHGRTIATLGWLAADYQADLLVVGASRHQHGLRRLIFPPTAEQLLGRIHASIAVVQPDPVGTQRPEVSLAQRA
ncbi:MAG TPA: universal stress protein [Longimicrobiales bacterium]|nr:universal stress protein [Longimicrobiales bacterium]